MFIKKGETSLFATSFGCPGAPAILGIGGWIGSWELWVDPFSALSAKWHTLAYDHRGTGATVATVASISFDRLVDDIFAVLDAYEVEECVLAAESAGAVIALGAALKNPERIVGLVIVNGFYFQPTPEAEDPFLAGLRGNYPQTLDWFVQACVPEEGCGPIKQWGRQILDRATPEAALALYAVPGSVDLRPALSGLTQPALILHGSVDGLVPLASSQWLAQTLPNAELVILDGAGHVPTLTRPAEVAQAVNRFFGCC